MVQVPRKATQTAVVEQVVIEDGEHAVQGERVCDQECETPDDGALNDAVWFDATGDEFKAESVMTQFGLVNNKLDDGGISPDRGEGDAKFHDEETQKKPPDPGYMKFKWISPGLLKTGILLMHLLLMMNPMIMMSGSVMMNTSGDGHRIHEAGFVYKERDTMGDAGVISMKTDLCPTGGRENILRFDKSVDAAGDNSVPVDGGSDARAHIPDRDGRGDDIQKQVQDNEERGNVKDLVAEKGAVHDQVPVDEGGGKTKAPQDEANLDKEVDVADQGAVNVEVPGSNGGSDAEVPERVDTTQVDNGVAV